jgi:beta-galactosidase
MNRIRSLLVLWTMGATFVAHAQREEISLNGTWNFALDSTKSGLAGKWFDRGFPAKHTRSVTVPHTWNVEPGSELYAGAGWYEREIAIPQSWERRTVRLRCDAVYHDAMVWVNGEKAGDHSGAGYTRFFVDITRYVKPGRANRIVVRADNAPSRRSIPFLRSFDWPNDGGIIRSIAVIATQTPAIDYLHVRGLPSPAGSDSIMQGNVTVEAGVLGWKESGGKNLECTIAVREENQKTANLVHEANYKIDLQNGCGKFSFPIKNARAWHFDSPNLYKLEMSLKSGGVETDRYATTFGFRDIRTRGTQIVFNGEPVRLMGVEWMPGSSIVRGMAETKDEMFEMLKKMRSVNGMFTRFHWQQDEAILDWCDRHGILVQEEVPLWGSQTPLNDTLLAVAKVHLDEMIQAHFNHPSVVMWGVGNELSSQEKGIIDGVMELCRYTRSLDNTRLVNYVSNQLAFSKGSDASMVGDVIMHNEYQDTWYLGDPARVGGILDTIHGYLPSKPLVISEYGLCEPANQGGDPRRLRDMVYHTSVYESKPYVAGAIYFCLNDYRTHMGEAGTGVSKQRVHGVFDIDGKAKPSAEVLAWLSSPVELFSVPWATGRPLEVVVMGSAGLPSYTLRGYRLYWSEPGADFRTSRNVVELPEIGPYQTVRVPLDKVAGEKVVATLVRPSGEMVLQRTFTIFPD